MHFRNKLIQYEFSEKFIVAACSVAFFPFVLFLRLIGGTWLVSNHHYPSLLKTFIVTAIVLGIWLLSKLFFRTKLIISGLEKHLIPFLAVVVVSTVLSSNASLSAEKAVGVGVFFLLALLILEIRNHKNLWEGLINSILLTALGTSLISLFSILYAFQIFQISFWDIFTRTMYVAKSIPRMPDIANLHITISAGYYLMVAPLAIYRWKTAKHVFWKIIIGLGIILSASIFFLIQSRGSMIGLFLMAISVIYLERERISQFIESRPKLSVSIGVIGLVIIVSGVAYIVGRRGFSFTESGLLCRFQAWKISIRTLLNNPIFGSGMETFGYQFLEAKDPGLCSEILHVTHNDILQILVNFGIAGFLGMIYFVVNYRNTVIQDLGSRETGIRYGMPALAGMVGMGLMTTMLYSPNIRFLMILYLVWMVPNGDLRESERNVFSATALIILICALAGGSLWMMWKIAPYFQARQAANGNDFENAEGFLEEAINRDPGFSYYQQILALIKAQEYCLKGTGLETAIAQYQESLDTVDIRPSDHANLASLWVAKGMYLDAISEMEKAISLDINNADYYCYIGSYYEINGEEDKAIESLSECIAGKQSWLDTPFWDAMDLSSRFQEMALDRAIQKVQAEQLEKQDFIIAKLYYYDRQYNKALIYLDRYLSDFRMDYEAVLYKSLSLRGISEFSEAVQYIEEAIDLNPRCRQCWLLLAEIALEEEDLEKAEKALRISEYLGFEPQAQYLSAKLHLKRDEDLSALEALRTATYINLPNDRYSNWVASRWHLDSNHLYCTPLGLTYQEYYAPIDETISLMKLLSDEDLTGLYESAMAPDIISRDYFLAELNAPIDE